MEKGIRKLNSFTDLEAWKQAHELSLMIYQSTKNFPNEEKFGLVSQMRRAVVSITSNLAEGFGRRNTGEKKQFYAIAQASLMEIQSQLFISKDIGYINHGDFEKILEKSTFVHKLITGLIKSMND